MLRYLCNRVLISLLTIGMLIAVTFFMTRVMPGSPFSGQQVSEEVLSSMETEYGLDQPVVKQFFTYSTQLIKGDFGISYKNPGTTVNEIIGRALPYTLSIGIPAFFMAVFTGVISGILQASAKHKSVRTLLFIFSSIGSGLPGFVTALLLALVFGVWLKWFPIVGLQGPAYYVLPVLALMIYPSSVISRFVSNTWAETERQEYAVMLKCKGISDRQIIWGHYFKNAILPVLPYLGSTAAFLLTGSFVVENIFTIPGLGREFVNSIANRDYTLIMGLTIFMGIMVTGIHLMVDLLSAWLNPRFRFQR